MRLLFVSPSANATHAHNTPKATAVVQRMLRLFAVAATLSAFAPSILQAQDTSLQLPLSVIDCPLNVIGGATLTATVALAGPAPLIGQQVKLSTNSTAAVITTTSLKVPGITVPSGQTKATFQVATKGVAAANLVTITAESGGVTKFCRFNIKPPTVTSVTLAVPSIAGGVPVTGTVRLDGLAPAFSADLAQMGGLLVSLTGEGAEATVPAIITVGAGHSSGTFQLVATPVVAATTLKVSAIAPLQRDAVSTSLSVVPAVVKTFTFSAPSVTGGTPVTGRVTLTGKAPFGGKVVVLTSNVSAASLSTSTSTSTTSGGKSTFSTPGAAATIPDSVMVPADQETATFQVATVPVGGGVGILCAADQTASGPIASLTVLPPVATSLTVQPQRIAGGSGATGRITLSGPAPPSGFNATVTNSSPAVATIPERVEIAAGQTAASFPITTVVPDAQSLVTLSTGQNGAVQTMLTVFSRSLVSVSLNNSRVPGGTRVNGTVSIDGPAPAAGINVSIDPRPCPGSVLPFVELTDGSVRTISLGGAASAVIPAGQTIGAFQLTTPKVDDTACFTVFAFQGGRPEDSADTKTTTLTALPPLPQTIAIAFPGATNTAAPFATGSGTVEFAGSWKLSPTTVNVSCTPSVLQTTSIPVLVANDLSAGTSRGTFTLLPLEVGDDTVVTCSVARGGITKSTSFTVLGPRITAIELAGDSVAGGSPITGTVAINRRAPTNGLTVVIDGNNGVATVSRVTIPAGQTLGAFQVTTTSVSAPTPITLRAALNGEAKTATFTVRP